MGLMQDKKEAPSRANRPAEHGILWPTPKAEAHPCASGLGGVHASCGARGAWVCGGAAVCGRGSKPPRRDGELDRLASARGPPPGIRSLSAGASAGRKHDDLRYFLQATGAIDYVHQPLFAPTQDENLAEVRPAGQTPQAS